MLVEDEDDDDEEDEDEDEDEDVDAEEVGERKRFVLLLLLPLVLLLVLLLPLVVGTGAHRRRRRTLTGCGTALPPARPAVTPHPQLAIAGGWGVGMVGGMSLLNEHIDGCVAAVESLREHGAAFEAGCDVMALALREGHTVMACGNGGSAADSGHFTTELLCRFIKDRASLPAISLAQDGGFLTATANDYGFEHVFSRQVEGLGREGDVLVGITTSGNSANVVAAFKVAKAKGMRTIALLGRDGGSARGLAELEFIVPGPETARIQEAHKVLIHAFCAGIEARLFPGL